MIFYLSTVVKNNTRIMSIEPVSHTGGKTIKGDELTQGYIYSSKALFEKC